VPDPVPVHGRAGFAYVLQVGAVGVADVEEVAEDPYGIALLPVAQERGDGHLQVLREEIQKRRLDGGDRVHGGAQVEGLAASATTVAVRESVADGPQDALVVAHARAHDEGFGVPQGPRDLLAAGHLPQSRTPLGVLEDDDVPGEVRAVGTGEVELHGVPAGDREDGELGDGGLLHGWSPLHRSRTSRAHPTASTPITVLI
jgi:hypothetical protein